MIPGSPLPWGSYPSPQVYDARATMKYPPHQRYATPAQPYMPAPLPQQQSPMYGYAPRYPAQPKTSVGAKLRVGIAVLAALLTVPVIAWGAFVAKRESKNMVVFVNDEAAAVDLVVDGAPRGKIPARSSVTVDVLAGNHVVVAGDDHGSFAVPQRAAGGFRGLYHVGGAGSGLAVVTKYYAVGRAPFDDKVDVLAEGTRFVPLPDSMSVDALGVDRPFPDAISVPQGTTYTTVTHVCRITPHGPEATVGCAGY